MPLATAVIHILRPLATPTSLTALAGLARRLPMAAAQRRAGPVAAVLPPPEAWPGATREAGLLRPMVGPASVAAEAVVRRPPLAVPLR